MNRALTLDDRALLAPISLLRVALDHFQSLDYRPAALGLDLQNLAALAQFRTGEHHHFIPFFDVRFCHNQMTSGASEIIFINFFSRSSRATGPKMRVPRGLFSLSMMTIALLSKRRYEPSLRRICLRVRTTTASTTSPFLTVPSGAASLMWALMTSPMPA